MSKAFAANQRALLFRAVPKPVAGAICGALVLWFLNSVFEYHDQAILSDTGWYHPVTTRYLVLSMVPTFIFGGVFGALSEARQTVFAKLRTMPGVKKVRYGLIYLSLCAMSFASCIYTLFRYP